MRVMEHDNLETHQANDGSPPSGGSGGLPGDLITSREAVDQFNIPYSTLMGWWQRGAIRHFKRGMYNLFSAAEVAAAVKRYTLIREVPPPRPGQTGKDDNTPNTGT